MFANSNFSKLFRCIRMIRGWIFKQIYIQPCLSTIASDCVIIIVYWIDCVFFYRISHSKRVDERPGNGTAIISGSVTDSETSKLFQCELCPKAFTRRHSYNEHKLSHSVETRRWCDLCQRTFASKRTLRMHMMTHTGEKPFRCEICNKRFVRNDNLIVHKRLHTGEKPYVCPLCDRSFTRSDALNTHLRSHCTGDNLPRGRRGGPEKPFQCTICQNTFTRKAHLTLHIRLHTGERPYGCNRCYESFSRKDKLTAHAKVHDRKHYFLGHSVIDKYSRPLYDIYPVDESIPNDLFPSKLYRPQLAVSDSPKNIDSKMIRLNFNPNPKLWYKIILQLAPFLFEWLFFFYYHI